MTATEHSNKLLAHLRRKAPYSIVDRGIEYAEQGRVQECSKSGNKLIGVVQEPDGEALAVQLQIVSFQEIEARCSCCSHAEMVEQWCQHAVALLWRSTELGFFDPNSGFAASESVYRFNTSTPEDIAAVLAEAAAHAPAGTVSARPPQEVTIIFDLSGDRLGVQVLFDDEPQGPALFSSLNERVGRALDRVLLQVLDDEGTWDDSEQQWYVNSSSGIELVTGLAQEYLEVRSRSSNQPIQFASTWLDARVAIRWIEGSAELTMLWVLPDGATQPKTEEMLGNGPFWTALNNTLYRISPAASKIARVFPYGSSITLTRSQVGPILEALDGIGAEHSIVTVENPADQPDTDVKTPVPALELYRRENYSEHFSPSQQIEIEGTLSFEYPDPPETENIVYLPNREEELKHRNLIRSIGFESQGNWKKYVIRGDHALDLVEGGTSLFPKGWRVTGLDSIKRKVRFSKLAVRVDVSTPAEPGEEWLGGPLDWLDCKVTLVQNNGTVPLSTIFKSSRTQTDKWIRLDNGSYARAPGGGLNQLRTMLGMLDPNFRLTNTIKTRLSSAQAIGFIQLEGGGFDVSLDPRIAALSEKLKDFTSITAAKGSRGFKGELRSYQEEGLGWILFLNEFNLGGVLADEMGLGKTVQALAALQYYKDRRKVEQRLKEPTLIIAPTSVITNWAYEARRFTPRLKTLLLHGPSRKSRFSEIPEADIVITSYALLRVDRQELEKYQFSYLILDEAQNIKNPQAATTKAAKALRARWRLALSGTPTENRPSELWSIMDFLMPGYLGSLEFFRNHIEKPILDGGPTAQVAKLLNMKTRPFLLRRTKAQVEKDLPPKLESLLHVEMTPAQQQLYMQILNEVRPRVFEEVEKRGIRGASVSILSALLRLRQVCNHPNSIDSLKHLPGYDSGKFELLKDLVSEALENGRKILLFSQFIEMLTIIKKWLIQSKVNYLYLDGSTKDRQSLIDRFNEDENVRLFLISLKAGGTGLNLTAADTVVIYDPWWNPAVEGQAVDRAHRIGQTKAVSVYRLITEDSVEQKIMTLKEKKARLFDALVNESGLGSVRLTRADLEHIFSPLSAESIEAQAQAGQ